MKQKIEQEKRELREALDPDTRRIETMCAGFLMAFLGAGGTWFFGGYVLLALALIGIIGAIVFCVVMLATNNDEEAGS
jgi:hypothetical protein